MADLTKWKPWYARIPGAAVAAVGTVLMAPYTPLLLGLWLMDRGLNMMRRPAPTFDEWAEAREAGQGTCPICGRAVSVRDDSFVCDDCMI